MILAPLGFINDAHLYAHDPILTISAQERVLLSRVSHVNKFGAAQNGMQVTATDIWDLADASATQQIWIAPTIARIHQITSDSAADDGTPEAAGAGAQAVRIWGLKTWSTAESTEDVVLNGVANVATANSYVIIHRMKVIPVGSTYVENVGTITATADTDGTITAAITPGRTQTLMAIYGVPDNQVAYITSFYVDLHDNANPATAAEIDYLVLENENPDIDPTTFLTKHIGGIISVAQSHMHHGYKPYKKCIGPCILKLQGVGSVADLFVSGGFDAILVNNT